MRDDWVDECHGDLNSITAIASSLYSSWWHRRRDEGAQECLRVIVLLSVVSETAQHAPIGVVHRGVGDWSCEGRSQRAVAKLRRETVSSGSPDTSTSLVVSSSLVS